MYIGFQCSGNSHGNDYLWLCLRMPKYHGTTFDIRLLDLNRFTLLRFELCIKERKKRLSWLNYTWLRVNFCNMNFRYDTYKGDM